MQNGENRGMIRGISRKNVRKGNYDRNFNKKHKKRTYAPVHYEENGIGVYIFCGGFCIGSDHALLGRKGGTDVLAVGSRRHDPCDDAGIHVARIFISVDLYRRIFAVSDRADGCEQYAVQYEQYGVQFFDAERDR